MAPVTHPEWPDAPVDREAFYEDLQDFHRQRGTTMDAVPKVSTQAVDIYDFFHLVQESGGYDEVSAKKLEWRRIAELQYGLGGNQNAAAYAFQLKSLFYRNLAAYAIARVYKQEPPPKDILEDLTAKGGNLLKRTRDAFNAEQASRAKPLPQEEADGSDRDNDGREDTFSGVRTSRLRQDPPQRQRWFPPPAQTRPQRPAAHQMPSPQPQMLLNAYTSNQPPVANLNSPSFQISSWEGRNLNAGLHVRPVPTPSSNETAFRDKIKRMQKNSEQHFGRKMETRPPMLPGTNYSGPNIYKRTLLSLRSGIESEVDYALHHLLKMSKERASTFFFSQYPGLADALISEGLKIASRCFDVIWHVSWTDHKEYLDSSALDGYRGTPDLLDRIANLRVLKDEGDLASTDHLRALQRATEIALVVRNMSLMELNARYMSSHPPMADLLTIWLRLPPRESLMELKSYALDTAEQLAFFWSMDTISHPLYQTLVDQLAELFERDDRGAITVVKAFARIGSAPESWPSTSQAKKEMDRSKDESDEPKSEAEEAKLYGISIPTIQRILDWTLLDDDEVITACLDFLYRYFSSPANAAAFLQACTIGTINHEAYFSRFIQLIRAEQKKTELVSSFKPAIPAEEPNETLTIPADLKAELQDIPEPQRAHAWLRCLFEEVPNSEIKQILLWQAYQRCWMDARVPLLQASEFIKNVSDAFAGASAQVIQEAPPLQTRFIIKNIRNRYVPVSQEGKPYIRCRWTIRVPVPVSSNPPPPQQNGQTQGSQQHHGQRSPSNGLAFPHKYKGTMERSCGSFQRDGSALWEHILAHHLGIKRNDEAKWDLEALRKEFSDQHLFCKWGNCRRFENDVPGATPFTIGMHIKIHMPDTSPMAEHRAEHTKRKRPLPGEEVEQPQSWPAEAEYLEFRDTQQSLFDGRAQPSLVSMHVCLVIRMLLRTVPKATAYLKANPNGGPVRESHEWIPMLMSNTWDSLFNLITYDRILMPYLIDIAYMTGQGMEDEDGNIIDTV